MSYSVVAVSPRTGKPLAKPRKGQLVEYAVRGPRGGVKKFSSLPQAFSKADLEGFQRIVSASDGRNFVVYEQLSTTVQRDAKGAIQYRTRDGEPVKDARGRKVPLKVVKLSPKARAGKQRTVILSIKRRVEKTVQDFAFRASSARQKVDAQLAKLIPLSKSTEKTAYSEEFHLSGLTIFDTLKNIKPLVSGKELKAKAIGALFVEGVVRVRSAAGSLVVALPFNLRVNALWNFSQLIAKEIRYVLAQTGYRFTSLAELGRLQKEADSAGKHIDLFGMGPQGRIKVKTLRGVQPERKNGKPKYNVSASLRITGLQTKRRSAKKPRKGYKGGKRK